MKVRLNNKFYKREAIEKAAGAFKEVCDCRVLNESFDVEIIQKTGQEGQIVDEFCNFVLGITKDDMLF